MPRAENTKVVNIIKEVKRKGGGLQELKEEWIKAQWPCSWANMRKYWRKAGGGRKGKKGAPAAAVAPAAAPLVVPAAPASGGKRAAAAAAAAGGAPNKKKNWRRNAKQVDADLAAERRHYTQYSKAHIEASTQFAAALAKGGSGPNGTATAVTIVKELNETISPSAPRKLSAEAIRRHVQRGHAGEPPRKPGPKMAVKKRRLLDTIGAHARVMQVGADTQRPGQLLATAQAAVAGTDSEALLASRPQRRKFLKRLRKEGCHAKHGGNVEERRANHMTYDAINGWFNGWEELLERYGFLEDHPTLKDANGKPVRWHVQGGLRGLRGHQCGADRLSTVHIRCTHTQQAGPAMRRLLSHAAG